MLKLISCVQPIHEITLIRRIPHAVKSKIITVADVGPAVVRNIHHSHSACSYRFHENHPRREDPRHKYNETIVRKTRPNLWELKDGLKDLRHEVLKWKDKWTDRIGNDNHLWLTPGKGLFEGFVNFRSPKYGRVKNLGYRFMTSQRPKRENVWTVPNALCVMRMGMAPVAAYLILNNQFGPAIGVFAVAGVTDLLDGWIARVVPGQSSVMGSFLDPMADKILVGTLFISLTYMDLIPVPLTALIIGRDAILIAAGFYIRYQSLEPPRTLSRYFNVTHPTAQLAPTFISKVNTGIQLGLVGATLASTILPYDTLPFLQLLWYCTATTTVASAVGYLFAKDTVKLLRNKPAVTNVDKVQEKKA